MAEWCFRIASVDDFAADLNDFCAAFGYPPVAAPDPSGSLILGPYMMGTDIRLDFDAFVLEIPAVYGTNANPVTDAPLVPAQDRGMHMNARATLLASASNADSINALAAQISSFFASCPAITNDAPSAYPNAGGQSWNATPRGSILINPTPAQQKRRWAEG